MPIDTSAYQDFAIALGVGDVSHPQALEVRVDPALNDGADILCIYSGTLMFQVSGASAQGWSRGNLIATVPTPGRLWHPATVDRGPDWTVFRDGSVVLSLASIYNAGVANFAGWATDAAVVDAVAPPSVTPPEDHLEIAALLAVRDADGILYRLSYQVTALGAVTE